MTTPDRAALAAEALEAQRREKKPAPGIRCPKCGGLLTVYYTRPLPDEIIRCRRCPRHRRVRVHTFERAF